MTVYGYIRVSTDNQTTENQKFEIERFLRNKNFNIDILINETISGTVDFKKRKIGKLLRRMKKGDILICSELSRLGRNTLDILTILNFCIKNQVQVWTVKENYRLEQDIQSHLLACVFSMIAQTERTLISQRTKEALQRIKTQGKHLGRPFGSKNKHHVLDGKETDILKDFGNGTGIREISKKYKVSQSSVRRFVSNKPPFD